METPRIVVVKWLDAWVEPRSIKTKKLKGAGYVTYTVGFLVKESQEGVWLSVEYWPKDPNDSSYPTFIPRGCIRAIIPLTAPYGKKLP